MNSALTALFDSLTTEAALDKLVQDGREEGLYLEFKQKVDRRTGDLADGDRRAFSKAVAGFANADGGVLIFGVETAKTADGIDRAFALKAIQDHQRFRARLMDSILNTTQPVVDGVRIESIPSASEEGYVKCLIPQSDKPPHRATLADHQYWRRISTGHRRMEHYELEDVVGRRLRPSLRLALELRLRPDPDEHEELHFYFLNEGKGVAKHSGLLCSLTDVRIAGTNGQGLGDQSFLNGGVPTVVYDDPHAVIHANGIARALGHAILRRENRGAEISLQVTWYAENMDTRRRQLRVTPGPREMVS
jgi:hypothetical protein